MATVREELELARALLRAPSPSGHESPAAQVLLQALRQLGYDEASVDPAGNVTGILRCGDGPRLMLNGHLDTVPVGDEALWPHPPLSGAIADGELWGRGACDMKAALAAMAHAGADARDAGFKGTLMVCGVVQEEVGSLGARYLAQTARADLVLLGEPSGLRLMHGHRGRVELHVSLPGRIAHAARGELGDNALYRAASFLQRLQQLDLPRDAALGGSSVTPTRLTSYPRDGANVVPGRAELVLDYRNIPADPSDQVLQRIAALDPECAVTIPMDEACSESGAVRETRPHVVQAYLAPADHPLVERTANVLADWAAAAGTGPLRQAHWWFCTDAPELARVAPVVLGFGPGDEELAHTTNERVPLSQLRLAREAYCALALGL